MNGKNKECQRDDIIKQSMRKAIMENGLDKKFNISTGEAAELSMTIHKSIQQYIRTDSFKLK